MLAVGCKGSKPGIVLCLGLPLRSRDVMIIDSPFTTAHSALVQPALRCRTDQQQQVTHVA